MTKEDLLKNAEFYTKNGCPQIGQMYKDAAKRGDIKVEEYEHKAYSF